MGLFGRKKRTETAAPTSPVSEFGQTPANGLSSIYPSIAAQPQKAQSKLRLPFSRNKLSSSASNVSSLSTIDLDAPPRLSSLPPRSSFASDAQSIFSDASQLKPPNVLSNYDPNRGASSTRSLPEQPTLRPRLVSTSSKKSAS